MKLWPSDSFEIETTLSPEEIFAILNANVEPRKIRYMSSMYDAHAYFEGSVAQDGFKINRVIFYRNSFLPLVTGRFGPGKSGTAVMIRMSLHWVIKAFMCFLFGGLGVMAVCMMHQTNTLIPEIFIPLGMMLLGWGMALAGFWIEANKQKAMLARMFKVEQ